VWVCVCGVAGGSVLRGRVQVPKLRSTGFLSTTIWKTERTIRTLPVSRRFRAHPPLHKSNIRACGCLAISQCRRRAQRRGTLTCGWWAHTRESAR